MGLLDIVNEENFAKFLNQIAKIYDSNVPYHNDLHGADVMQMAYYMMDDCSLKDKLMMS